MKKSLRLLAALALAPLCASLSTAAVSPPASGAEDRAYLVGVLTRVAPSPASPRGSNSAPPTTPKAACAPASATSLAAP
ncbi:MAG: hypothetical protein MUE42_15020 [Opitutaceae bacterium]|nr:hypothetical protein [Opitutaceae bacterium]